MIAPSLTNDRQSHTHNHTDGSCCRPSSPSSSNPLWAAGLLGGFNLDADLGSAMSVDAAAAAGGEGAEEGAGGPAAAAVPGPAELAGMVAAVLPHVVQAVWDGVVRGRSHDSLLHTAAGELRERLDPQQRLWIPDPVRPAAAAERVRRGELEPERRLAVQQALDSSLQRCYDAALALQEETEWVSGNGSQVRCWHVLVPRCTTTASPPSTAWTPQLQHLR